MKKKRVVVAMSGGVDSAVAAALLQKQGYEVIGMTMCFNLPDTKSRRPGCCGRQGIEDARRVAHLLGVRHYVVNMQKALEKQVVDDFCREYLLGRTPNPCVRCNQHLKFDLLLKKALFLGAEFLSTGHYARIERVKGERSKLKRYMLKKAKDEKKDQSYFLYRLGQEQLSRILFPLGEYSKIEVRRLARRYMLPVANKPGSQEICFLPDMNYRRFLSQRMQKFGVKAAPGPVIDQKGRSLGQHRGIAFYTIGQREGLGIALGYPAYIIKIDAKKNQITVGKKEEALAKDFLIKEVCFVGAPIKKKIALKAKIRYNHQEMFCAIWPQGQRLRVSFHKPQFAITPGQSAVIYDKDKVVGGGIIDKVGG